MKKLVIEDNTIYEIDEDCIKMKKRIQKQYEKQEEKQHEQQYKKPYRNIRT